MELNGNKVSAMCSATLTKKKKNLCVSCALFPESFNKHDLEVKPLGQKLTLLSVKWLMDD